MDTTRHPVQRKCVAPRRWLERPSLWIAGGMAVLALLFAASAIREALQVDARRGSAVAMAGLALLCAAIGVGVLTRLCRQFAAQNRAGRVGEKHRARVLAHRRTGPVRSRAYVFGWRSEHGCAGWTTVAVPPDRLPRIGTRITILVDPQTGRGWWTGDYG